MTDILERYDGPATIRQGTMTYNANVNYTVEQERVYTGPDDNDWLPGMRSWQGSIRTGYHVDLMNKATLELPDGRTGTIIVMGYQIADTTSMGSSWKEAAMTIDLDFVGTGAAP